MESFLKILPFKKFHHRGKAGRIGVGQKESGHELIHKAVVGAEFQVGHLVGDLSHLATQVA